MIMTGMTLDEFENLLDAKGPDIGAWPRGKRRAAERLLARSADARAALGAARRLETDIADALRPDAIGADLRARLDAIPLNHPRLPKESHADSPAILPTIRRWWYAGAATAMASVVAGIVVGATLPPTALDAPDEINLAGLVYGPSDGGLLP